MIKLFQKLLFSQQHQEVLDFIIKNAHFIKHDRGMIIKDLHRWHSVGTANSFSIDADNKTLNAQQTEYLSGNTSITYHIIRWPSQNGIQRSEKIAEEINTKFGKIVYNKMYRLWARNNKKAK